MFRESAKDNTHKNEVCLGKVQKITHIKMKFI